jgi:hypothetical protein
MWLALSACYFLGVLLLVVLVLWRRRHQTAVYNIDPAVFEEVLIAVFDHLGLLWSQSGSRFFLRRPARGVGNYPLIAEEWFQKNPVLSEEKITAWGETPLDFSSAEWRNLTQSGERDQTAILSLDPSPALYHVTLRWSGSDCDLVRQEVELELAQVLRQIRTPHNPLGGIMMLLSGMLMTFNLFLVAVLLYYSLGDWPGP